MKFSYFVAPISNKIALKDMTLPEVYELIVTDFFKRVTDKVRSGKGTKSKDLAYITPCGTFKQRKIEHLLSYSGIQVIDLDNCDITLKSRLAADPVLRPALIFISPSFTGLKLLIRVDGATQENHLNYYMAICRYLLNTYGLVVDKSGSDIPRACFLCYDPDAYYNPDGFVTSEALIRLLPPPETLKPCNPETSRVAPSPIRNSSFVIRNSPSARNLPPAPPSASTGDKPSDKLNRLPEIHNLAVSALERNGWQLQGDLKSELWTRPNKEVKKGCSAIYNVWDKEGIWIMTVFSSNAFPFKAHKGYTDVQILCLLNYNDDWTTAIADLASRFLEPV